MKKALKDYAQGDDEKSKAPVQEKSVLFKLLDDAVAETIIFCKKHDIDLDSVLKEKDTFKNIGKFEEYADILLQFDEWRKSFYVFENTASSLYEACKPEIFKQQPRPVVAVIQYLRGVIESHIEGTDIDDVSQRIAELLDESIVVDNYNSGGSSNENYFEELIKFTKSMKDEDERHIREGLSEDELELFDTLKKEKLSKQEEKKVKLAAHNRKWTA